MIDGLHCKCSFSSCSIHPWYIVHCHTGKEKFTSTILHTNLGLVAYVPEIKIWKQGEVRYISLFPGYFFLQADLQQTTPSQINTSPGVLRLLECNDRPQAISTDLVEALFHELTRQNEANCFPFHPGDTVYVTEGPLRGLEAVFLGPTKPQMRVQVLLQFLGRSTKAEVNMSTLEKPVGARKRDHAAPRQRYTRGKGRKIYFP